MMKHAQTIWAHHTQKGQKNKQSNNAGGRVWRVRGCDRMAQGGVRPRNDRPTGGLRWGWSLSQNE